MIRAKYPMNAAGLVSRVLKGGDPTFYGSCLLARPGVTMTSSGTACGLPTALLGRLRVADNGPTSRAKTTMSILQLLPGTSTDPHKLVAAKSPLRVPSPRLIDGFSIETARVPVFMTVTVLWRGLNRGTDPNEIRSGKTLSCKAGGPIVIVQFVAAVPRAAPSESTA